MYDKLYVKARANLDYVSSVLTTLKDVPAQYRDSGGTNAAALEADTIKKIDDTIKTINNVAATTTERNLMVMATENTITNIKRVDKNSRRML